MINLLIYWRAFRRKFLQEIKGIADDYLKEEGLKELNIKLKALAQNKCIKILLVTNDVANTNVIVNSTTVKSSIITECISFKFTF